MRFDGRRILLAIVALGAVVSLLTAAGAIYDDWHRRTLDQDPAYAPAVRAFRDPAGGGNLNDLLGQIARPLGWKATFITEAPPERGRWASFTNSTIVAGSPAGIVGLRVGELQKRYPDRHYFFDIGDPFAGSDGKEYAVYVYQGLTPRFTLNYLTLAGAVAAWLALALWLFADARSRGSSAPGWLLLGLLTGPVGVAVWMIARPARQEAAPPKPAPASAPLPEPDAPAPPAADCCPGCGAEPVRGTIFCVRCGHPLRPSCPECRRPVEPDWAYCGACGAPLNE